MLSEEIIKELNLIPESKLAELYDIIHYFRIGIEQSEHIPKDNVLVSRQAGILKGQLGKAFFEPLPEEELKTWE